MGERGARMYGGTTYSTSTSVRCPPYDVCGRQDSHGQSRHAVVGVLYLDSESAVGRETTARSSAEFVRQWGEMAYQCADEAIPSFSDLRWYELYEYEQVLTRYAGRYSHTPALPHLPHLPHRRWGKADGSATVRACGQWRHPLRYPVPPYPRTPVRTVCIRRALSLWRALWRQIL